MTPLKQCANHQFRENTTNRRPFSLVSNALSLAATSSTNRVSQSVSHCHHCKRISDICSSQPERRSVTKNTHTHTRYSHLQNELHATVDICSRAVASPRARAYVFHDKNGQPGPTFPRCHPQIFFARRNGHERTTKAKTFFFPSFFSGDRMKKKKLSRQHFICAIPRRRLARGCHPSPPALSPPARPRRAASDVIRVSHGEEPILSFSSSPTVDGSLSGYMNKYM